MKISIYQDKLIFLKLKRKLNLKEFYKNVPQSVKPFKPRFEVRQTIKLIKLKPKQTRYFARDGMGLLPHGEKFKSHLLYQASDIVPKAINL